LFRYVGGFPEEEERGVAVVQYLIRHGADVNAAIPETGWTPLHLAAGALEGCIAFRLFATLCEARGDVSSRDNKGQTPLDVLRETLEDY
jgi:ankyrin repeat protein